MMKNNIKYDFLELLSKFFNDYLPTTINASPHTIKSYKCTFRLLFNYLNEETTIKIDHITFDVLSFELLNNFFDWLVEKRNNSKTTAKQRMGALASFACYTQNLNVEDGYYFYGNLSRIAKKSFRRVKSKQRCIFTKEELKLLFAIPDTSTKIGWRDLVILTTMYSSGARAQEICNITVKDISYLEDENAILTLNGKGNKTRRVKITRNATKLLTQYISTMKIENEPNAYIFPSQRNYKISVSCIEEIFKKYIKIAKTQNPSKFCTGQYTPHVMRHTTATHLIEAGIPIAIVKNILGHTSIQTTQVYLDISQQTVDDSIKEWNEKWFPSNNSNIEILTQKEKSIPDFLL